MDERHAGEEPEAYEAPEVEELGAVEGLTLGVTPG